MHVIVITENLICMDHLAAAGVLAAGAGFGAGAGAGAGAAGALQREFSSRHSSPILALNSFSSSSTAHAHQSAE